MSTSDISDHALALVETRVVVEPDRIEAWLAIAAAHSSVPPFLR
jgi:hypothetical protein